MPIHRTSLLQTDLKAHEDLTLRATPLFKWQVKVDNLVDGRAAIFKLRVFFNKRRIAKSPNYRLSRGAGQHKPSNVVFGICRLSRTRAQQDCEEQQTNAHTSNENKISDAYRERASIGGE